MLKLTPLLVALAVPGPLLADDYRSSVPVERGGKLELRIAAGSVEIDTHDESVVEVEAVLDGIGTIDIDLDSDGRDATLRGRLEGVWNMFRPTVRLQVRVPERFSVDIETGGGSVEVDDLQGSVDVSTSAGSIEVDDVVGDVEIETSGGYLNVGDITGNLSGRTSGGDVDVSDVSGEVDVHTSGGKIQVHDVGGPVYAETSGGRVSVRFVDAPEGQIRTSGGGIDVEFAEGAGADLDASTSGGRVRLDSDLDLRGRSERSEIVGELNGGGPVLVLHTSGGNVHVKAR